MKNREKFAKEILDVACKGLEFAVTKSSKITYCSQISCKKCIFKSPKDSEKTCRIKRYEWSESEYVKKPKYTITSKEKMFFDLILAKWKYIVRDNNGVLYAIDSLPIKEYDGWRIEICQCVTIIIFLIIYLVICLTLSNGKMKNLGVLRI